MRKLIALLVTTGSVAVAAQIPNPSIDYPTFQRIVFEVARDRELHRLTEKTFLEAMTDKNTVVLDARSVSKYTLRHVQGAISLPFTDFTAGALAKVIPSKMRKVLVYCNNNFEGSDSAFPAKAPAACLNLSTYTSLRAYGYTKVFEHRPLLNVRSTAIPFEGSEVTSEKISGSLL
jgi:phage shock protein E